MTSRTMISRMDCRLLTLREFNFFSPLVMIIFRLKLTQTFSSFLGHLFP